jgi:hypothetical protein
MHSNTLPKAIAINCISNEEKLYDWWIARATDLSTPTDMETIQSLKHVFGDKLEQAHRKTNTLL